MWCSESVFVEDELHDEEDALSAYVHGIASKLNKLSIKPEHLKYVAPPIIKKHNEKDFMVWGDFLFWRGT